MTKCSACGQELRDSVAPAPDRVYVPVPAKDVFAAVCRTLRDMTDDAKFRDALVDLPKTVERFGRLTEGQWKYFAVIHSQCTGIWPSRGDFLHEAPPQEHGSLPADGSLDDIPF